MRNEVKTIEGKKKWTIYRIERKKKLTNPTEMFK